MGGAAHIRDGSPCSVKLSETHTGGSEYSHVNSHEN